MKWQANYEATLVENPMQHKNMEEQNNKIPLGSESRIFRCEETGEILLRIDRVQLQVQCLIGECQLDLGPQLADDEIIGPIQMERERSNGQA